MIPPRLFRVPALLLVLVPVTSASAAVAWRRIDSSPQGVLPVPHRDVEPTAALAVDVNKDGDADLIVGGRNSAPALTLFRHDRGRWTAEVIESEAVRIEAGGAVHDIDGDGDPDLVFGGDFRSGEIWWWENPHPAKTLWTRRALKRDGVMQHHDQLFGDFLQGVAAARLQNGTNVVALSWHKNTSGVEALVFSDDASKWELKVLSPFSRNEQVTVGDLDRDAAADLLLGDYWLRNTGTGWTQHEIGTVTDLNPKAEADRNKLVDVNGDGWLDAVVSLELDPHIVWFEHPGKEVTGPWKRHVIGEVPGQGFSMDVADFDADGDFDVVVGDLDLASIGFYNSKVWVLENKAIAR